MTGSTRNGSVTFGRRELVARLASIVNRLQASRREGEHIITSVTSIAAFITECGREFDLSNDEQMLFLKFVACGDQTYEQLLKGEEHGKA